MTHTISRRKALMTGAASSGLLLGAHSPEVHAEFLPEVWGEDFLTPWSPPETVKRDLKPGKTPIRLSCSSYRLEYRKGMDFGERIRQIKSMGYTACEANDAWKQASDSEIREAKAALAEHDLWFYALHICVNSIHPDMAERQKNIKRVTEMVEAASRIGLKFVISHTGSCFPGAATLPHRDNWTEKAWKTSVESIKQILRDTSGSNIDLGIEALNPCNINNPRAHVKLREDVGDPRVKVTLDPQNMLNTATYYRTTELINECFDLLGEDILYAHAKDVLWKQEMLPAFEWVVPGTGTVDFATYLTRLSQLKYPRPLLLEFLQRDQYPASKKHIEDTAAKAGVTIYS